MPRRYRPERRVVPPDPKYGSTKVESFINRVMRNGKKSVARRLVYQAFDIISERTGKPPLEVFEQALKNVMPFSSLLIILAFLMPSNTARLNSILPDFTIPRVSFIL